MCACRITTNQKESFFQCLKSSNKSVLTKDQDSAETIKINRNNKVDLSIDLYSILSDKIKEFADNQNEQKAIIWNHKFNFSSKLRSAKSILFTPALPNILKNTSTNIKSNCSERSESPPPVKYNLKSTTQRTSELLQKIENQKKRLKVCIPLNRSVWSSEVQEQYFKFADKPVWIDENKSQISASNKLWDPAVIKVMKQYPLAFKNNDGGQGKLFFKII